MESKIKNELKRRQRTKKQVINGFEVFDCDNSTKITDTTLSIKKEEDK